VVNRSRKSEKGGYNGQKKERLSEKPMVRNCGGSTYFMTPTNSKLLNNIVQYEERRKMSRNRKSILKNERLPQ
jgi:hypothetical protein